MLCLLFTSVQLSWLRPPLRWFCAELSPCRLSCQFHRSRYRWSRPCPRCEGPNTSEQHQLQLSLKGSLGLIFREYFSSNQARSLLSKYKNMSRNGNCWDQLFTVTTPVYNTNFFRLYPSLLSNCVYCIMYLIEILRCYKSHLLLKISEKSIT